MKRLVVGVILFILANGAIDLMRQRGWVGQQPVWAVSAVSVIFGVFLGRWSRNRQQ